MPSSRLEQIFLAARFRGASDVSVERGVELIENALLDVSGEMPTDDRALLKIAATAVAFYREVSEICLGEYDLDFREQAILDAVLEYVAKGES